MVEYAALLKISKREKEGGRKGEGEGEGERFSTL